MNVSCPRCQLIIDCSRLCTGQQVACPRCSQPLLVPHFGLIEAPPDNQFLSSPIPPPFVECEPPQQQILISTGSRPLPRLRPSGWFSNAYGTTMGILLAIATVGIVFCGGIMVIGAISSTQNASGPASKVTARNFNRVRTGMNPNEVRAILGDPSEVLAESEFGEYRTIIVQWNSDGIGNCNVTFQNGRVVTKAQFGLR